MRICSIASGSSGNCIYVGNKNNHILIDAGISRKRIVDGLASIGVAPEMLDAIFVTHEHSDHISGIPMMVKMFGVPIFATGGTLDELCRKDRQNILDKKHLFQLYAEEPVAVGDFHITPFAISHDAAEPVCYTVECGGKKFGMATDLGKFDSCTVERLAGSDMLLLEANHDISMLLCKLIHGKLRHVFLAHLSKENNYPQLAYEAVKCQLWEEKGMTDLPFAMEVANRDRPSDLVSL